MTKENITATSQSTFSTPMSGEVKSSTQNSGDTGTSSSSETPSNNNTNQNIENGIPQQNTSEGVSGGVSVPGFVSESIFYSDYSYAEVLNREVLMASHGITEVSDKVFEPAFNHVSVFRTMKAALKTADEEMYKLANNITESMMFFLNAADAFQQLDNTTSGLVDTLFSYDIPPYDGESVLNSYKSSSKKSKDSVNSEDLTVSSKSGSSEDNSELDESKNQSSKWGKPASEEDSSLDESFVSSSKQDSVEVTSKSAKVSAESDTVQDNENHNTVETESTNSTENREQSTSNNENITSSENSSVKSPDYIDIKDLTKENLGELINKKSLEEISEMYNIKIEEIKELKPEELIDYMLKLKTNNLEVSNE